MAGTRGGSVTVTLVQWSTGSGETLLELTLAAINGRWPGSTLRRLRTCAAIDRFYTSAVRIGNHPFQEFAAVMQSLRPVVPSRECANAQGIDFTECSRKHPARQGALLTQCLWKQHFAANPLRSDLHIHP